MSNPAPQTVLSDTLPAPSPEALNPVGWFEIYVQDMARARTFYETVFNVSLTRLDNPEIEIWTFPGNMNRYGITGALVRMEGFASGDNSVLVYFSCQDCAVEAARAVAAGGRLHKAKMSIGPFGFIALVTDSENNMIGLHSVQ